MLKTTINLISNLQTENRELEEKLKREQEHKQYLSTLVSDHRYTIRQLKSLLENQDQEAA